MANSYDGTVSVIDTSTNTVTDTITVGHEPEDVAFEPSGAYAYVVNDGSGTVSVIDTSTNTVTDTITVGTGPTSVAFDPSGAYAYVTNSYDGTVSVIDTSTNTVTDTIGVGKGPEDVAFEPSGVYAYVTNYYDGTVSVIDTSTNTVTDTIGGVAFAWDLAFTPDGSSLYVTQDGEGAVAVIDPATNAVTTELTDPGLLDSAADIGISADGSFAYVGDLYGNDVAVIDTATNAFSYIKDSSFDGVFGVAMNGTSGSTFAFSEFFAPIANPPNLNVVHAGQGVPVQFSLGGNQGLDIFAAGSPSSTQIDCSTQSSTGGTAVATVTAGSSSLQYDPTTDTYTYVWKTDKSWAGTCRELTLRLSDGTTHTAYFQFT